MNDRYMIDQNANTADAITFDWLTTWTNSLQTAFLNVATKVGLFLPNVIFAILILLVGWLIASSVAKLVRRLLDGFGLDELWENLGFDDLFKQIGFNLKIQNVIASLVKWFLMLVFLITAADVLNLPQISGFIEQVAAYIPNVIAAAVIIFIGIVAANALGNAAGKASRATRIVPANIIVAAVRYPILVFAALAALSQLQIATDMIRILFGGIVFALSLALGLAFGLGGRDEAKRILEGMSAKAKSVPQQQIARMGRRK
jgi:hypothetical protein